MSILFLLIPLGMIFLGVAIWAFLWAVRSGQFDDMEGPAHRILMDDDDPRIPAGRSRADVEEPQPETETKASSKPGNG